MAAVNLDSLRTLWASIKSWLQSHLYDDETVLWTGSASNNIVLSEVTTNFNRIRIYYADNDGREYAQEVRIFPPNGYFYDMELRSYHSSSSSGPYLKSVLLSTNNNDCKTIVWKTEYEANITSSNTLTCSSYSSPRFTIKKVVGIHRVST
jgi:hypothetical protein